RVQLDAGKIGEPRERGGVSWHHLVGGTPRWEANRDDLDPLRPGFGSALLIEEVSLDAVWKAHEHVGPPSRSAQRSGSDGKVVLNHIELGVTGLREEQLARIGDRHFTLSCRHDLVRWLHSDLLMRSRGTATPPRASMTRSPGS